jgi:gliding motility associated protien GldN
MIRIVLVFCLVGLVLPAQLSAQPGQQPRNGVWEQELPRDGVWERARHEEKKPIELPYVREADVLWSMRVWQVIDLREKMNQPMYFPPTPSGNMRSLMQVIMDGIADGTIRPYSLDADDFSIPLDPEELLGSLHRTETITMERPDPPYDQFDTTITISFNPADVMRFRIKEDWYFDTKRSVLEVRVLGICPVVEAIDPITGETRGDAPLFWIYFPEVRDIFVNAPVFNRQNDAQRMSYDDLFLKRFFSGTIYKASNVQDRRIGEYYTGMDALLEARRIQESIRNFEHDLWEY